MQSTLDPRPIDPIARYLEQIASENEQIARTLADDAARPAPAAVKNVQVPGDRPSFGRPAARGFVGLLLAACIGVAAFAWQSYGDAAKPIIAKWAPQLVQTSSLPLENPGLPAQPTPTAVQADAATAAPSQPAPLAQTAPESVAPAAALSPESAQLLQTMARDLATVRQEIEQLKASIEQLRTNQEQMTRDNARAAEQFKASQEQMARDIAKASELRPKTSAPPPRPTATPTRKPAPILPPPQARAQPQDTPQPQAEPQLPSAPRLPVR
jgi:DNA-binding protein H-NS